MLASAVTDVANAHGLELVGLPRAANLTVKRLELFRETLRAS